MAFVKYSFVEEIIKLVWNTIAFSFNVVTYCCSNLFFYDMLFQYWYLEHWFIRFCDFDGIPFFISLALVVFYYAKRVYLSMTYLKK